MRVVSWLAVGMAAFAACAAFAQNNETPAPNAGDSDYLFVRGGLDNCRIKFTQEKAGRVVYLGGSITTMNGWRALTYDLLKQRFPETTFDFIDAGIGGTNSSLGAFRFQEHGFKNGPVDLLFLEYAVNDGPGISCKRAMEGIIRHARKLNPKIDIIVQYFVDKEKWETYTKGETPEVIAGHDSVVSYYNLSTLNLALEMSRRLDAGQFTWEQFSGDTCHPLPFGHEQYAECISKLMDAVWSAPIPENAQMRDYPLPAPLDPMNYENGRFIDVNTARVIEGWSFVKGWTTEKTCNFGGPVDVLTAETPGATLELEFEGTLIGYYGIAGMDAGILECSIDGGEPKTLDLFDHYCEVFHRPVCHLFATDLQPGKHTLRVKMKPDKNEKSQGAAARLLEFVAN